MLRSTRVSVLDLAPIVAGGTASDSFKNSVQLAQLAETLGYYRYWVAEHHSMPGIASSATSVVIGHIAAATRTIRVGSGGIMLPNHAPLVIAEQFGTLESMYPGRIDLGLGRAPGSDYPATQALRKHTNSSGQDFPELLEELRYYLSPLQDDDTRSVRAIPGEGLDIPIWLLGSSGFSAQLAAELGLPFAFASHFAPDYLLNALELYRSNFKPSHSLKEPHVMIAANVVAADTEKEAKRLATSQQLQFLQLIRRTPSKLQPPVDTMEGIWTDFERSIIEKQQAFSVAGTIDHIEEKLSTFLTLTDADELIVSAQIYDHQARLNSFQILANLLK